MKPPIVEAFETALEAIAHAQAFAGIEIVRHDVRASHGSMLLRVTIDREGGVDLALCERVAAAINARLEGFRDRYGLEVESAGLNRRLSQPRDYERFRGRDAKVITSLAVYGSKTHRGVLRGMRGSNVILETVNGELPLPLAAIRSANLEYDVRSDLRRAKKEGRKYAGTSY